MKRWTTPALNYASNPITGVFGLELQNEDFFHGILCGRFIKRHWNVPLRKNWTYWIEVSPTPLPNSIGVQWNDLDGGMVNGSRRVELLYRKVGEILNEHKAPIDKTFYIRVLYTEY